jgi:hypothetical protein
LIEVHRFFMLVSLELGPASEEAWGAQKHRVCGNGKLKKSVARCTCDVSWPALNASFMIRNRFASTLIGVCGELVKGSKLSSVNLFPLARISGGLEGICERARDN